MKKVIFNLVVIIYVVIAIFVTICLLTFNRYKISEIAGKTLVIIDKDDDSMPYKNGDLVIVGKNNKKDVAIGDYIFFYQDQSMSIAKVEQVNDFGDSGVNYVIEGNYKVVGDEVAGTSKDQMVLGGVGTVLGFLESRWGFLFIIVFPSLIAFLREIRELITELSHKND